jgi:Aminomethyltransferase folate-binding domain
MTMNSDAWRTLLPAAGASPSGETSAASLTEISAGPSWPLDFGDRAGEYAALHQGAAIVPLVSRSLIAATGPDAAKFLHNLSTNDVRRLTPGAGCETFFLNAKGHVLAHAGLICRPDAILIDTSFVSKSCWPIVPTNSPRCTSRATPRPRN